jgi:hypothetical protein
VLRGDPIRELETVTKARGGPVLTLNEARATQNLPPMTADEDPSADLVLMPSNMLSPGEDDAAAEEPPGPFAPSPGPADSGESPIP